MHQILQELINNDALRSINENKSYLGQLNLNEEALLLATSYMQNPRNMMVVKANAYQAQKLFERLDCLIHEHVLLFHMEDSLRVEAIATSPENKAMQMETMAKLLNDEPYICILNTASFIRFQPSPKVFKERFLDIKVDMEIDFEEMKRRLFLSGYTNVKRVDQPLCYASRGGIIDVFSINYDYPIRIEFFDNIIESIRYFDIASQRTIQTVDEVHIIPANSFLLDDKEIAEICENVQIQLDKQKHQLADIIQENLINNINDDLDKIANHMGENYLYRFYTYVNQHYSILDYVKDPQVIISNKEEVQQSIKHIHEEMIVYVQELFHEGKALCIFTLFHEYNDLLIKRKVIEFQQFVDLKHPIQSQIYSMGFGELRFEQTMQEIIKNSYDKKVLIAIHKEEAKKVKAELDENNISYKEGYDEPLKIGITISYDQLVEGFHCINENIIVYTSKELFKQIKNITRYSNKFKDAQVLSDYQELEVGDYVVHNQYGIGKYLGTITRNENGIHKDFLHILYAKDSELFVPLEHFQLVRKFVSKEGSVPRLSKLGTNDWEKKKAKVSEKVAQLASRLVELYANREENIGFAYSKDTPEQKEFEQDFEYALTSDQQSAVYEIKMDMESNKPMDRLLCGDVGFGKTEVAAIAAFKAIMDQKQVAYLCPTTILSIQHYKTFIHRFRNFPVNIALVNRFVPKDEQRRIIRELNEGKIDILIGTHRLLSKDIKFKDLGFLIIDEEQRFGVEHKEKIKELKNGVDVLSLSATPIPRTLQMSLIGIRSLSQLNTPPSNRMPVQTYVLAKNENMILEIIQRELARDGQIFYLFNRVDEIYQVAMKISNSFPDTKVGVAHGRMTREEIEDVMQQFTENKYQILVCTTIIETGIDIPNANTIIIEDADRFGLSQLYQIKGRVGRSDRLAYAYLMYSPDKNLNENATKRLKAIKEFAQLGSGYKIAMRDLTIRGAGDLLGPQQAGFIDTVGIDMYIEMLNAAIQAKKGIPVEKKKEIKKRNIKLDAYIPEKFANEDYEKLRLYQRIDDITDLSQLSKIYEEVEDNYGKLPKSVELLFEKKNFDILLNKEFVEKFEEEPRKIKLIFTSDWSNSIDGVKLFESISSISKDIILRYTQNKVSLQLVKRNKWLKQMIQVLTICDKM